MGPSPLRIRYHATMRGFTPSPREAGKGEHLGAGPPPARPLARPRDLSPLARGEVIMRFPPSPRARRGEGAERERGG
jgi:hypothetical protein